MKQLVSSLPADFKGSVFIVLHIPAYSESRLPWILEKAGRLQALHPKDGDKIEPGKIYIGINDHLLIIEKGKARVTRGPKENWDHPFRSSK